MQRYVKFEQEALDTLSGPAGLFRADTLKRQVRLEALTIIPPQNRVLDAVATVPPSHYLIEVKLSNRTWREAAALLREVADLYRGWMQYLRLPGVFTRAILVLPDRQGIPDFPGDDIAIARLKDGKITNRESLYWWIHGHPPSDDQV